MKISIDLEHETAQQVRAAAAVAGCPVDRWIVAAVQEKLRRTWPAEVVALAGAWVDFPTAGELRDRLGEETPRAPL